MPLDYKHLKRPDFFVPLCMHFSDSSNGFILTTGSLMQLKNHQWVPVNTGEPSAFFYSNVFTIDQQNTFLCGYDGKVSKFNGDSLSVIFSVDETTVVSPILNTIFMTDSVHGWAAGESGTVIKIDSTAYTLHNQLPMYSFRDMYFDTPDHGWMIGYTQENIDNGGVVFEYKNEEWNMHSAVDGRIYDIEFSSPGHGFITTATHIYAYNSTTDEWVQQDIPGYYQQYHLSLLDDNYGISVSDNYQVMTYENGVWSTGPAPQVADLACVYTTGHGSAWAVSQIGNNNPQDLNEGKIQQLQDNSWSAFSIKYLDTIQTLPLDIALTNILATDKKNIWFDGGHVTIPDNKDWPDSAPALSSDTFCTAIKMFSNNFGLGLNGDLLEWNGQYWLNKNIDPVVNPDTSISNICMHVFDDTTGFIGRQLIEWSSGDVSNIISHYNYQTNSLSIAAVIGSRYPTSIHFANKRNGWCAGDSGLIVQYSDGLWNVLPSFTTKRLNSVFTVNANTAWAAGEEGSLFRYNGNEWEQQQLPTQQNLHRIYFTDSIHGWIAGDSGLIFRYDGNSWVHDSTGYTNNLYSIYMVDSAYGFAGGENGLVLQYIKPAPPVPMVKKFCEYGDTWFVYHPEGNSYTYQWQVDTGNGFENISNDIIFSGTTTDTLRLTEMPSDFYGFKFRCVASFEGIDSVSTVEELKFVNRWTGAVSNAWEDPGNWSCGSLPGENTDVVIPEGEIIINTDENIRSLSVGPGVHITISDGVSFTVLK